MTEQPVMGVQIPSVASDDGSAGKGAGTGVLTVTPSDRSSSERVVSVTCLCGAAGCYGESCNPVEYENARLRMELRAAKGTIHALTLSGQQDLEKIKRLEKSSVVQLCAEYRAFVRDTAVNLRGPWEAFKYAWESRSRAVETSDPGEAVKRWKYRENLGDLIESHRGEYVLYDDHAKALSARLQQIEFLEGYAGAYTAGWREAYEIWIKTSTATTAT